MGDLVCVGSCAGKMYAFEAATGKIRWQYDVSGDGASQFHGNPLVVDSVLYFGTDQGGMNQGVVYALHCESGGLIWKSTGYAGMATDLTWDGGSQIYGISKRDTLYALDAATGQMAWSFASGWSLEGDWVADVMVEVPPIVSSPLVADSQVYFCGRDSTIYALDFGGRLRWSRHLGRHVTTGLVVHRGALVVGISDWALIFVDMQSGEIVRDMPVSYIPQEEMLVADSMLVFLAGYQDARPATLVAMDHAGLETRWQQVLDDPDPEAYWYVPRIHRLGEMCVVGSTTGRVFAFDLVSGEQVWETVLDSPIRGVGHGAGMLFVGTFDGTLHALPIPTGGDAE